MSVDMSKIDPRWEQVNGKRLILFYTGMAREDDFRECVIRAHPEIGISVAPANKEEEKRAKLDESPNNQKFFFCTRTPETHLGAHGTWEERFNLRIGILYDVLDKGEILTFERFAGIKRSWATGPCPFSS
jgi:hypothetical protein